MFFTIGGEEGDPISNIRAKFVKTCLAVIKRNVAKDNYILLERKKNLDFIKEHLLTLDDVKDIILDLSPNNCTDGPEEDYGGYEGYVLEFKTDYLFGKMTYIKIRYNPPEEVVCISFHEDE